MYSDSVNFLPYMTKHQHCKASRNSIKFWMTLCALNFFFSWNSLFCGDIVDSYSTKNNILLFLLKFNSAYVNKIFTISINQQTFTSDLLLNHEPVTNSSIEN